MPFSHPLLPPCPLQPALGTMWSEGRQEALLSSVPAGSSLGRVSGSSDPVHAGPGPCWLPRHSRSPARVGTSLRKAGREGTHGKPRERSGVPDLHRSPSSWSCTAFTLGGRCGQQGPSLSSVQGRGKHPFPCILSRDGSWGSRSRQACPCSSRQGAEPSDASPQPWAVEELGRIPAPLQASVQSLPLLIPPARPSGLNGDFSELFPWTWC